MPIITFTVCVGIRAPVESGEYIVQEKKIQVSYPSTINLGFTQLELPKSLSTLFIVTWEDSSGVTTNKLRSKSFERHLPIYEALDAISDLLLAYKLVRVGHADGRGLRTIGIGDTLMYTSAIDGIATGDLNVGLKNYAGNSAWISVPASADPHGTSKLAAPHIGTDTIHA